MIDCAPSVTEIIVPAPEPSLADAAVSLLLSPLQPLREQFSAVTAIGLGSDDPEEIDGSVVRRIIGQAGNAGQDLGYLVAGKEQGAASSSFMGALAMPRNGDAFFSTCRKGVNISR